MVSGQSKENSCKREVPRHVAIIMDGNGRWAQARGLNRTRGHRQGVEAVRKVATAARDLGVQYLTLFSFSSENWSRPKSEIEDLFSLLRMFVRRDLAELHQNNVCVRVIGDKKGVPENLISLLAEAEHLTRNNTGQTLVIAFNYGARNELTRAARKIAAQIQAGSLALEQVDEQLIEQHLDTHGIPDPELIIRTSGEKRLSNFLLWQAAYSEFVFVDCLWPDFDEVQFGAALDEYYGRTRRFGGLVMDTG